MFTILTALVVILVIIIAGYSLSKFIVSPAGKGLLENNNIRNMNQEQASDIINRTSPFKTDMEIAQETEIGGEIMQKVSFSALSFSTEDKTGIVLLPKNPHWIFAYWHIIEKTVKDFDAQFGSNSWNISQPLLKIYDHTEDNIHDISINDYAHNWYLQVYPDRYYTVILGRRFPCGKFIELAASNKILTASAGVSSLLDKDWLPIDECWKVMEGYKTGISSPELMKK